MATSQINVKTLETKFNDYFAKLIYAVFDDISKEWNNGVKFSPFIYLSYNTICLDKKNRPEGLKAKFTISTEVRQYLSKLFMSLLDEVRNVNVAFNNIKDIKDSIDKETANSYSVFMFNVGAIYKPHFGSTLKNAMDTTKWFNSQLNGILSKCDQVSIALIYTAFDDFLKAMAWLIGKLIWYHEVIVSSELFLGILAQQNLAQLMLDDLANDLRAKKPKGAKKDKVDKTTTTTMSSSSDIIDNTNITELSNLITEV